jgi:hypothetical protein
MARRWRNRAARSRERLAAWRLEEEKQGHARRRALDGFQGEGGSNRRKKLKGGSDSKLHHALMRGLEGGEGWRRGGNCRRQRAVEMQRRRREVEGKGPDTRGQAVSDYKRVEGKNWTGRGRAGRVSWAATLGRKKREEKGRAGKEREGGELEGVF